MVFVAGGFLTILDSTIINVALPAIGRSLRVAPTAVGAISITYLVATGVSVSASGWLADHAGAKRTLLCAMLAFTVASGLCGLARTLSQLVILRTAQGLAGGLIAPVGLTLLFRTFPQEQRVRVSSMTMIPTLLAPAAGPIVGGLLVTDLSWRYVFFVNLPLGLAASLFGVLFVAEPDRHPEFVRFDVLGFLSTALGLGLLMFGLAEGPSLGWSSDPVLVSVGPGLVLLALSVRWCLRAGQPVLRLRLFANDRLRSCSQVSAPTAMGFVGMLYGVALYFQYGRGLSPLTSGLSAFPDAVGVLCGGQLASRRLYRRYGARRLVSIGIAGSATAMALMATMGAHTSLWWARLLLFAVGVFLGLVFIPTQVTAFSRISPADTSAASTLYTVVRQVAGAFGVAALTTVVGLLGPSHVVDGLRGPNLTAYRWPFLLAAALTLAGLHGARRMPSEPPPSADGEPFQPVGEARPDGLPSP